METWQSSFFCRYLADPGQIPELKIFIWYGKIEKNIMFFFCPLLTGEDLPATAKRMETQGQNPINTEALKDMENYKQEFIQFMVDSDVLKFGDFTLKSGRKSPFFMNAGAYVTGSQLKKLGEYYAKAIHERYGDDFDVLFGPAYKGIPLAVVTAIAYSELYGKEVRYCSDRKEEKDHGADKGSFLGSSLKDGDRVIMIEDVTTSGKSMEETVPKVRGAADVTIVGLMVSLDRMEVGKGGEKKALDEIHDLYGFDTAAIVTMAEVVECLWNKECDGKVVIDDTLKTAIDAYYEQYGAK